MSRDEFMKELEYLLQDIPEEDKADALDYYRDYLEEAGEEAEQVIQEFGSPERIAAIIRADIAGHLEDGGEFTECGYGDERFREPNYQVANRYDLPEQGEFSSEEGTDTTKSRNEKKSGNNTALKVVLGIVLVLVGFPMILGLGGGAMGILFGLLGILLACVVTIGVLTVAFFLAGIAAGIAGILALAIQPLEGLLAIGVGFLMVGLAFLCLVVAVQFYGKFLPWLFTGTIDLISGLFRRREKKS